MGGREGRRFRELWATVVQTLFGHSGARHIVCLLCSEPLQWYRFFFFKFGRESCLYFDNVHSKNKRSCLHSLIVHCGDAAAELK